MDNDIKTAQNTCCFPPKRIYKTLRVEKNPVMTTPWILFIYDYVVLMSQF